MEVMFIFLEFISIKAVTRVKPFICTMPLRLDEGWNQIQLNLADYTRRAYGTNYVETLRVQVHANCRLRRIYFADRLYSEEELPPEFKLYLPMQVAVLSSFQNASFHWVSSHPSFHPHVLCIACCRRHRWSSLKAMKAQVSISWSWRL